MSSAVIPRFRLFAGPNGSGKSTLNHLLPADLLGIYLNADDIERTVRGTQVLDLALLGISSAALPGVIGRVTGHPLMSRAATTPGKWVVNGSRIIFPSGAFNSYDAAAWTDAVRRQLITERRTCSSETVMSSPDKIDLLATARAAGFRTYLYFIATEDPVINLKRIANRVLAGGHDVPRDKVIERHARSLDMAWRALPHTNRAYFFDNSRDQGRRFLIAEITDGRDCRIAADTMPDWFVRAIWKRWATS